MGTFIDLYFIIFNRKLAPRHRVYMYDIYIMPICMDVYIYIIITFYTRAIKICQSIENNVLLYHARLTLRCCTYIRVHFKDAYLHPTFKVCESIFSLRVIFCTTVFILLVNNYKVPAAYVFLI